MSNTTIPSLASVGTDLQHQLKREFSAGGTSLSAECPAVSPIGTSSAFSAADLTLGFREIEDLAAPNLSPGASALYHTTGLATAVYAVSGPLSVKNGLDQVAQSESIQDEEGVQHAKANIAVGGLFTVGAASMGTFRGLSIANALNASKAPAVAVATLGCFVVGNICFAVGMSILTGVCMRKAYQGHQFQKELSQANSQAAKIKLLQAKMNVTDTAAHNPEQVKAEGRAFCKAVVKQHMKACDLTQVTDEELDQVVGHVFGEQADDSLLNIGLQRRIEKAQEKNIAKLSRVMTEDGKAAMEDISKLTPDQFDKPHATTLLQRVEKGLQEQKTINMYIALVCALSAVGIGLILGFAGGWPLLVAASVVLLVSAILMLTIDYTYFQKACENTRPGLYDKYVVGFAQFLAVASVVSFVVLCALGVVTLGGAPGVMALFVLFIWICHNEHTRQSIDEREKRYRTTNPTLEFIAEALESGDREMSTKMINKLKGCELNTETVTAAQVRNLIADEQKARREALAALFAAAQPRPVVAEAMTVTA